MGLFDGFLSLGDKTNKTKGDDNEPKQGAGTNVPELSLDMPDEDLIDLTKKWKQRWDDSELKTQWTAAYQDAEKYWKGEHYSTLETETHALMDNAIFEALETFLPQATRRNAEGQVEVDQPENADLKQFGDAIEKKIASLADALKVRLKIKKAARHWAIYRIAVAKVGWSQVTKDISLKIIRPTKLILDPDGTVDEDGYTGEFVGEFKTQTASLLIATYPEATEFITKEVNGKMGTEITYIEWNTNDYICWTLKDHVLGKSKNVNWNYDNEVTTTAVDDYGGVTPQPMPAKNHFIAPRIPYIFLSVYNLGKNPIDDTGLIQQNLPLQDLINKRLRQIDMNADSQNGGIAVSGDHFTIDQAKQVSGTVRKGGTIWVPTGNVNDAVLKLDNKPLSSDSFQQLVDTRNRLADVFGTRGSTASGIQGEETVRGKIITRGLDSDRIGGGVTEYLEQFADDIYNWFVQLMYVYYHLEIPDGKLTVSVKEGSLLPKDNVTQANQAVDLATAGLMSLLDLYTKLEDPNPKERAANAWLEKNAPQVLYADDPRVAQVMQQQAEAAAAQQQQAQEQQAQAHGQNMQVKAADHENKLQLQQAKTEADLLKQVPTQ